MRILSAVLSLCLAAVPAAAQTPVAPRSGVPGAHVEPSEAARAEAQRAQQALRSGDAQAARLAAERAADLDPLSYDVQMLLGACRLADGRPREAYQAYAQAGLLHPASAESYNRAGQILLQFLGRPAGAKAAFEQALRIDAESAPPHFSMHYYHVLRGELAEAAAEIDRALQYVKGSNEHFLYLGVRQALMLYTGDYAGGLNRLDSHVQQVAGDARAMQARVLARRLLGSDEEAERDLRELLGAMRDPAPGLVVDLGLTMRAQGERDSAKTYFEEALRLDAGRVEAIYNLALESLATGDTAAAIGYLQDCIERHPHGYQAPLVVGRVWAARGDTARARRAYEAAYRRAPFSQAAAAACGRLLLQPAAWQGDTLLVEAEAALLAGDTGIAAHKGIEACGRPDSRPLGLARAAAAKSMVPGSAGQRVAHLEAAREASADADPMWLAALDTGLAQAHDEIGNREDAELLFRAVLDQKRLAAEAKVTALSGLMALLLREQRAGESKLGFSEYEHVSDARFWQLRAEWATALGDASQASAAEERQAASRLLP